MGMLVYSPTYDAMLPELGVNSAKDELVKRLCRKKLYREGYAGRTLRTLLVSETPEGVVFKVENEGNVQFMHVMKNRRIAIVERP